MLIHLAGTKVFAQNDYFSTLQLNVAASGWVKMPGGLKVSGTVIPGAIENVARVSVGNAPQTYIKKQRFKFAFTVANDGGNDILISEWHFRAICPENSAGTPWQEAFFIPLATPYVSKEEYLVLKPGEKKSFFSAETDFAACIARNEETALMTSPKYFTALVTCMAQPSTSPQTASQPNKTAAAKEALDPELQNLIKTYQQAANAGQTDKLTALNKDIMDIAMQAYPDRIAVIQGILDDARKKAAAVKPVAQYAAIKSTGKEAEGEPDYAGWLNLNTLPIQLRFGFVKKEGNISYYKLQFRIDFEDQYICHDADCVGYNVTYMYRGSDGKYVTLHYIFLNSYKGIYTMDGFAAIETEFSDNSKIFLHKSGYFLATMKNGGLMEAYITDGCADYRRNSTNQCDCAGPHARKNIFKESEAIVLK